MSDDLQVPHRVAVGDLRRLRIEVPTPTPFTGAGREYRSHLAELVDAALRDVWELAIEQVPRAAKERGVSLAVVGSQARRDAGPLSDLDVLLLHDGHTLPTEDLRLLADRLWYPIWDAGLDLDHSVRSLDQCRGVASSDLVSAIGLLDVRHVAGDAALTDQARSALRADWRGAARARLHTVVESVAERARRHGELAYLIEPDLKEARGGLRDGVVIGALVASWLVERPHAGEQVAYDRLCDVRDALSHLTRRPGTRLSRADALDVAHRLGFAHPDDLLAMLAQDARTISSALDVTVRYAQRAQRRPDRTLTRPWIVRGRRRPPRLPEVGPGLALLAGELVLAPGADPGTDPVLPLRAAAEAATQGVPLSPVTLRHLRSAPPLPEPWPAEARQQFLRLLSAGESQIPVWEACDLAGLVVGWVPEWTAVRNRPQRSPVHRHTVDRHLVQTVANAAELLSESELGGLPLDLGPIHREAVLLAAVLHDIGKVSGAHDHSETGAKIAVGVLHRLGLTPPMVSLVVRLVREHLTLAEAATNDDPEDPRTVERICRAVGFDAPALTALRLLTEADASAAGPKAWTAWRAALVDTLTRAAHRRLSGRR